MTVHYFDKIDLSKYHQRLLSETMSWEVFFRNELGRIFLYGQNTRRGHSQFMSARKFLDENVQIIRLKMFWVLRGIVSLRRLLSRCRLRREKRTLFVQATSWGQPKSGLSCFSGSINTQVKGRIHAFILK